MSATAVPEASVPVVTGQPNPLVMDDEDAALTRNAGSDVDAPAGGDPVLKEAAVEADSTDELAKTPANEPSPLLMSWKNRRPEMVPLTILATLAVYYTLYAARAILLPIMLAGLIALTLRPIIRALRRYRLPDAASAALTLGLMVMLVIAGIFRLVGPAEEWVRMAPAKIEVVKTKLHPYLDKLSGLAKTSETVTEMATAGEVSRQPLAVEIRQSGLTTNLAVASVTGNVLGMASLVLALAYFLLAAGDRLLNNAISLLNHYSEKRKVVELVYDVERGIASYLLMVTCINAGVGLATTLLFWLLGVPHPGLWGLVAFTFNYVPVFGPIATFLLFVIVSIVTFDSLAYAMIAPLGFAALASVEGNVITPYVMGRRMSINPIVVFLSLIFWGWMWGLGGAVLAVPLVAIFKIACEKFERTRPIAVLLGD